MTTTDLLTCSLLGRARDAAMLGAGVQAHARPTVAAVSHAAMSLAPMSVAPAYVATTRPNATDVATNPWLGGFGFGFGEGTGTCFTTVGSIKRIHPGRPEGVT